MIFFHPELVHIRNLYDMAKKGLQLNGGCRQQVEQLMMQALTAEHFKRVLILLEILNLIAGSKEYSLIASTESEYKGDQEDACRLDRVHAYTLEHFKREISLAEIAAVSNLSITSFCRYFKSTTKTTYFDFLIQVRVNFACRMIIEDRYSIATICFECGFNNVANFYRHFKKLMQLTPVEYKRKYAKEIAA
ncbi:helix-turn-helix domain-containing protein [Niabella hibiscisoli]|uniref:helix-turn-helix domain-containing protein n=1 Tax=Niabella hibiscisoli TaxID=1825928 RepID=UPI001F0DE087|nr:AraC family transcriptional regulator [Niabella hibiscisoli]MCH5719041.1 AraC family transcriptional regulator [Niabella hibiscisoli]